MFSPILPPRWRQCRPIVEILEDRTLLSAVQSALQLPLSFEANVGQTEAQIQYLARGQGYALFLTPTEAVLRLTTGDASRNECF